MEAQLPARETLPALIRRSLSEPRDAALLERVNETWVPTSSEKLLARVENLACAIRGAGLQHGDRVALIAGDCVDWVVVDFATLFAGCVIVPIFPTQALDQVAFILNDSQAKLVFADTVEAAQRLKHLQLPLPQVVVFQSEGEDSLTQFEAQGGRMQAMHPDWPQALEREISPDEMAVLIYTSGTTGEPKGVMLSHYNLVFTAQSSFSHAFDVVKPHSDVLSVLPFSHIYEHCIIYGFMLSRVRHHISHHVDELARDLREVRPLVMTAVPRLFERVLAGIATKAKTHGGLQAKLIPWALDVGRDYMSAKTRKAGPALPLRLQYFIAHALVLRKIRPLLGLDRLKFFVSGSAPLHFDTAMTLLGFGVTIVEGYGPTECSPVITVNTFEDNHYGTVGKPIPGVEIRIAPDGEVLARGPNVMMGYYKNKAATNEVIEDGWYHTGDIGTIDADGYLRITDRKKELFKTSGGKFVAPSRVEAAIKRSVYVNQVMLVGDSRPHPVALILPDWGLVRAELGISANVPVEEMRARHDVVSFLTREVHANTHDLAKWEQVRRIVILPRELSIEGGELSPTLKIKRRVVEAKYAADIERLYADAHATSPA